MKYTLCIQWNGSLAKSIKNFIVSSLLASGETRKFFIDASEMLLRRYEESVCEADDRARSADFPNIL